MPFRFTCRHLIEFPTVSLGLTLALLLAAVSSEAQTKEQATCVASAGKAAAGVVKAQGQWDAGCVRSAGKEKLTETVASCQSEDGKGKVAKARTKLADIEAKKCSGDAAPAFGFSGAVPAGSAAVDESIALLTDVLGSPVDETILTDKDGAKCQVSVMAALAKHTATRARETNKCLKSGLKDGVIAGPIELAEVCLDPEDWSTAPTKVTKARDGIVGALEKKCPGTDLATTFPGLCSAAGNTPGEQGSCLAALSDCRMCRFLQQATDTAVDCDLLDNNLSDDSCGLCGNGIREAHEQCDGDDDGACSGQCSSACSCPGERSFTFDAESSDLRILGIGPELLVPLGGDIPLDVGEEIAPGVFPFEVGVGQLPPALIDLPGLPITVCVFFEQSPSLASGIAGEGVLNCAGADISTSRFFASPEITEFHDHCVEGAPATCDSAPNPGGGIVDETTGIFLPDHPVDPECDDPGNSPDPEPAHAGACNPVPIETVESAPYRPGDVTFTAQAAFDVRVGIDACNPPISPTAPKARIEFTTGTATTGIMDLNANAGGVVSLDEAGAPFDCTKLLLENDGSGAKMVGAFPVIDLDVSGAKFDIVLGARLFAE